MKAKEFYEFVKELTGSDKTPDFANDFEFTASCVGACFMRNLFEIGRENSRVEKPAIFDGCMAIIESTLEDMKLEQKEEDEFVHLLSEFLNERKKNNG